MYAIWTMWPEIVDTCVLSLSWLWEEVGIIMHCDGFHYVCLYFVIQIENIFNLKGMEGGGWWVGVCVGGGGVKEKWTCT